MYVRIYVDKFVFYKLTGLGFSKMACVEQYFALFVFCFTVQTYVRMYTYGNVRTYLCQILDLIHMYVRMYSI